MSDRIKFILNISAQFHGQPLPSTEVAAAVHDFVANVDQTVLAAIVADPAATTSNGGMRFVAQVPPDRDCLLFYKIPQIGGVGGGVGQADEDEGGSGGAVRLGMLTLEGGLVKSIYSSVTRVYAPHVAQRSEYSPELEQILESLHTSLGSSLGFPKSGVHSIQDEINFWAKMATDSAIKADREKAKVFVVALGDLNQHVKQLEWGSMRSLTEFLDTVHGQLDDLWRLPENYPQNRLQDLLDIVSAGVVSACADHLRTADIFSLSALHVGDSFAEAAEHLGTWLRVCDSLTRLFWPNNGQHQWLGEPHEPRHARQFVRRLDDIAAMRAMFQQIVVVFAGDETAVRRVQAIFGQFKDVNLFDTTPFGSKRWTALTQRLEQQLQPIDAHIATLVRAQLRPHVDNARQIVHLFAKNTAILRRRTVMQLLAAEQEQFACAMHLLLDEIRNALAAGSFAPDPALNLSAVCNECQWLRMFEHQLTEIGAAAELLEGHAQLEPVRRSLAELQKEVGGTLQATFEQWRDQSLAAVQSGELTLKTDRAVVEFEPDGRHLMRVTFNPRLVTFCQDVRQLESLALRVPLELRDTCALATGFMASARRLQQIANFHNTIGDRMVACQRPIMLSNAMELNRLVHGESVTWNDRESVDRYVHALQVSVGQLDRDNAFLYGQHEATKAIIVRLMNVDLIRQAAVWKEEMRRLHDIVSGLEAKGYQNLGAFKLHWDHQLYKVLEHQYVAGLSDLSNKLPDIHIDLVFRQQELQFRPPLEEIRFVYFEHLRKFLERPLSFRGLSDQSGRIFGQMIARNRHHFDALYARSEEAFAELEQIRQLWRPWLALGQTNVEDLCAVHLRTAADWDRNFKSCKHLGQQVAKIQTTEMRTHCFRVDVMPLRADIEQLGRRFWDTLASTLRTAIVGDIDVLQRYVHGALQVLQNVPLDEAGIAEAGARYERIMAELPAQRERLAAVERKDTCLAGWCKERVSTLYQLVTQWEQLQPLIENHSLVLQRQIDMMRDHIEAQLAGWREEAEKFEFRWEATVQEMRSSAVFNAQLFGERRAAWAAVAERRVALQEDCARFNIAFDAELDEVFGRIDAQVTADAAEWEELERFNAELAQVTSEEWTVYRRRPYVLSDLLTRWGKQVTAGAPTAAAARIRQQLDAYQQAMPILQTMQADGLTERHWSKIFVLLGVPGRAAMHELQLSDVLAGVEGLREHATEIQSLVREAAGEQVIRQALAELEQWGATAVLGTAETRDSRGDAVALGRDFQEVLNKIGDHLSLLQSAKNSSAIEAFADQATIWETRLLALDSVLTSLNQIQRKWVYLEPIFNNGTMKSDGNAFQRIDKDFRYIMKHIAEDTRLLSIVKIHNIVAIIEALELQLTRCQSALQTFITLKRNAFPRFYFLADDDLLEILGQSSRIDVIQKHIAKLFPGIHALGIDSAGSFILDIRSHEGDIVTLPNPIHIAGVAVEQWLSQLVDAIRDALIDLTDRCGRLDLFQLADIEAYPAQCLSTAKALSFTRTTEKAIQSMALPDQLRRLQAELELYNSDAYRVSVNAASTSLTQTKIRALLIDLVHYVDVIQMLIAENVTRPTDWQWLQQLKFYSDARSRLISVRMVYAEFAYSYEYLGTGNTLVHTALTHNCYLTLTQAMHMGLGGNPFGPAGTGKTECVKSLGARLGRLVLVFNCSENVDTAAMALILTGLARCGAWGCFDEFNRLPATTLADVAALIRPLQLAIKAREANVRLLASDADAVPLNLHCGIFVTLNPAGEEYGGRQQLPGSLQSLFRPIVMQQPEPADIAGVLLFAERFRHAKRLGCALVEMFRMCEQMLSGQRHYDWGLRELRTVLMACGKLRAEICDDGKTQEADVFEAEARLVVRALRSNTMSKLSAADCGTFEMLLARIFANVADVEAARDSLHEDVQQAFDELGLAANDAQLAKCLQLHEQLTKRMGVVVYGPPLSGKSTIIAVLKQALSKRPGTVIRQYTIAPKAMTRDQLLGTLDPDTRQWRDGVLTNTAVVVNAEPPGVTSWIICDGDVDPEWIEALNSVLDDNRLLTLPSGWRIQFGPNVHFLFETHDLRHASPATISRMGIVSLSSDDLGERIILESWLHSRHLEPGNALASFAERLLPAAIDWLMAAPQQRTVLGQAGRISLLQNALLFLSDAATANDVNKEQFCAALLRGLGSAVPPEQLRAFCAHVFELCDIYVPSQAEPELCHYDEHRRAMTVYETDVGDTSWDDDNNGDDSRLVRTAHALMHANVLRCFLHPDRRPFAFLLLGPSGSGKSVLLRHVLAEHTGYQLVTIRCSAQLTAASVLHTIRQHCITVSAVRGREYRAKQQRLVVYLKNVDLCAMDAWGTCAVTELVLQIVQRAGFYATDTLEWIAVRGVQMCASVSTSSVEAPATLAAMSERFVAAVRLLAMGAPSEVEMQAIFRQQLRQAYRHFDGGNGGDTDERIASTVDSLLDIYYRMSSALTRAQQTHYVFNPKMLSALLTGLRHYPADRLTAAVHQELIGTFRNRLSTVEDRSTFDSMLASGSGKQLMAATNPFDNDEDVYFVPHSRHTPPRLLTTDAAEWRTMVEQSIAVCSAESLLVRRPLTAQLLQDVAHIVRVLCRPASSDGHLVLCGRSGCGRQAAVHVACTRLGVRVCGVVPVPRYGLEQFYGDVRAAVQVAALEDQPVVFYVEHAWIVYLPQVMRACEALLQGSEIDELFGDDVEGVASGLRGAAQAEGFQDSLTAYFWMRVHRNFHLVLSLDTDAKLAELFQLYPCLYQSAEMLFVRPPSDDTTSDAYTQDLIVLTATSSNLTAYEIATIPAHHADSRHLPGEFAASPLRQSQLASSYAHLYHAAATRLHAQIATLQAGVTKLAAANGVVDQLQQQATVQELELADKKRLAQQSLDQIAATMRSATVQRTSLLELREQTQASGERLLERKAAIERELRDVEPVLREATAAVGQIRGEALSEIRSLRAPPDVIRDILEGVLRLMGVRDTSWNSMKSFLAKRGVKEDIRALDPVRITPENCAAVERLLETKADSFAEKNAKRASAAAAPLATWVIANVRYARVMQSIRPLEREQAQLEKNLAESEGEMRSLTSGLDDVDGRVKELSGQLNLYTQEAAVLEIRLNDARQTLGSAQVLVAKLSAEYGSWQKQLAELEEEQGHLGANTFLISVAITHLSHCTMEQRAELMEPVQQRLELADFNLTQSIISEQDQIIWQSIGLTADVQAIENAAVLSKMLVLPFGTAPVPLLLDPSGDALLWLRAYLQMSSTASDICAQTHPRFAHTLELAVRFGKCLLVPDFDTVRPPLLGLLDAPRVRFNKPQLSVGAKLVDLHADFRLVLVTRESHVHLEAAAHRAHIACMPFTTTVAGYTDQLMTRCVLLRQPQLEQQRREVLAEEGRLLGERGRLQQKLLQELSAAEGDILRNAALLATLNEVKQSSDAISAALVESHRVRVQLMQQYAMYREYCHEAARFYGGLGIAGYAVGVLAFTELFVQTVEQMADDGTADVAGLARLAYAFVARTTPKADHAQLGLQVVRAAFPFQVMEKEWESFITNFMSDDDGTASAPPSAPVWLQPAAASKIQALQRQHPTLFAQLDLANQSLWHAFAVSRQTSDFPPQIAASEFQKLLVTQCLRPDLLLTAAARTVCRLLGLKSLAIGAASVAQLADETTAVGAGRAVLLLLQTGGLTGDDADPRRDVQELAAASVGAQRYTELSASRGNEGQTLAAVRTAQKQQHWCCVSNVHLLPVDALAALAELLEETTTAGGTSSFKLWLIADAAHPLPAVLQHKCTALLYEPPDGVKLQLLRQLQRAQPTVARLRDPRAVKLRVLLYVLHSVLLERRRYVPQGWSQWYEFGAADARTAQLLIEWLETAQPSQQAGGRLDWTVLRGLCALLAYGGRISRTHDRRLLDAHLAEFLHERALTTDTWRALHMDALTVPLSANIADHMAAVAAGLPDAERPQMLGLAAHTNGERDRLAAQQLLKRLRGVHLSRTAGGDTAAAPVRYEKRLRPILGVWKKLNAGQASAKVEDGDTTAQVTPWQSFVRSELRLAAAIVQLIHATLLQLQAVAKQNTDRTASESELRLLRLITADQVPNEWRALWSGPRGCIDYLRAVRRRSTAAQRRAQQESAQFAGAVHLADVFNLTALLAALKLTNAAELRASACDLVLRSTLAVRGGKQQQGLPETRLQVVGLRIDGATLRGQRVALLDGASATLGEDGGGDAMPEFQLFYTLAVGAHPAGMDESSVELPVYASGAREQLVCELSVSCAAESKAIVLAGVALVVQTADV